MPEQDELLHRYCNNYADEQDSAALYAVMARQESDPETAALYQRLSDEEQMHARFWKKRIELMLDHPYDCPLSTRTRILIWLAKHFGNRFVLQRVSQEERLNQSCYDDQPETDGTGMAEQERSHARLLSRLASGANAQWDGSRYARLEGKHGAGGGNTLRAAVLGANDGLVSTLSLVMGAAGAAFGPEALMTTALAGMLAGACSMAMGEWISVQSSRELYQRQIAVEADELENLPQEEEEELRLIYSAKGFPDATARQMAAAVIANKSSALDTLAREELGINPDDLGGSAWEAAITSFFVFLLGALPPVLPLLFLSGQAAMVGVLFASGLALFLIGAGISLLTGTHWLRTGLRQLLIGAAAAWVTYLAGGWVGQVV
jgi:VIT1/CCC1 family predicted Fe2+/Mn2+ transporter